MPDSNERIARQLDGDIDRMTGQLLAFGRVAVEMPHLTPEQHEYIARERKLLRSGIDHAHRLAAAADHVRRQPPGPWAESRADVLADLAAALDAAGNSDGVFFESDPADADTNDDQP